MKATVRVINKNRGVYAAEIDDLGEYVIFELLDSSEPEIDDVISHSDFYSMGCESYKNVTQGCNIEVAVENVCGANLVKQQCFHNKSFVWRFHYAALREIPTTQP